MKSQQMNAQEKELFNRLPIDLQQISHVTNGYQDKLKTLQHNLQGLYGERADWAKCLKRYYENDEAKLRCHVISNIEDVPELSLADLEEMIAKEQEDLALIQELKDLQHSIQNSSNKEPSTPAMLRAASILGIHPDRPVGLNRWLIDMDEMRDEEKDAYIAALSQKSGALAVVEKLLIDQYIDGMMFSVPAVGSVITQGKRRYYYRGENAYYASSKPSAFRAINARLPDFVNQTLLGLRMTEAFLFLDHFDAVLHWPLAQSVNYLALGQHYGLRTPMMDITNDLKTTLFFACCTYENGKWRPLRADEFAEKDSREDVFRLGGDSRFAILYRSPTEITDMQWALSEDSGLYTITPVGYQPFLRCSTQNSYMLFTSTPDYDMMKDHQFEKYKLRLSEALCQQIFSEMKNGSLIYPNEDIPDLSPCFKAINETMMFSEQTFDLVCSDWKLQASEKDALRKEFQKYGITIIRGEKEYMRYNVIQKANQKYSAQIAVEKMNLHPHSRPMLVIS